MGVMQALVSFVLDSKDTIRSISTGLDGHLFVFMVRSPIILVAVSQRGESETQLIIQLTYIYSQASCFFPRNLLTLADILLTQGFRFADIEFFVVHQVVERVPTTKELRPA